MSVYFCVEQSIATHINYLEFYIVEIFTRSDLGNKTLPTTH